MHAQSPNTTLSVINNQLHVSARYTSYLKAEYRTISRNKL